MIFQALSVVSPAGSLIRSGRKIIEVRRWQPPLLPLRDLVIVQNEIRLTDGNPEDPHGSVVALADVTSVREWREEDPEKPGRAAYNRFVPAKLGLYEIDLNPKYLLHPEGSDAVIRPQGETVPPAL